MDPVFSLWATPSTTTGLTACRSSTASPSAAVRTSTLTTERRFIYNIILPLISGEEEDLLPGFVAGVYSCDVVVSGEVTYRSKFLKSDTYKRNIKADRIVVSEFGTMIYPDPCKNIFSRYRPSRTCRDLFQSIQ